MEMNFKMPKLKFGKIKMDTVEDLDKIDYEKIKKDESKKKKGPYTPTNYKTVKEFFYKSVNEYADLPCILEKKDHKEPYSAKTYKEFAEDVDALGTALIKILNNSSLVILLHVSYNYTILFYRNECIVFNKITKN